MRKPDADAFTRILFNTGISAFFLVLFFVFVIFILSLPMEWAKSVNDFADVLSGFFMPITIIFLILNYIEQKRSLLDAQEENRENTKRMEFSLISPIMYDIVKSNYNFANTASNFKEIENIINIIVQYAHSCIDKEEAVSDINYNMNIINTKMDSYEKNFRRDVRSYFDAYMDLRKMYNEAFSVKGYTGEIREIFEEKSPFDKISIGIAGRRLAFYYKTSEMIDSATEFRHRLEAERK